MSNYIVSAQKPTVVNGCVVGNFRTEEEIDLIIARINRIELLLVTEEGLKPHREIPVFGRIALIQAFRPPGEKKDLLFILTAKYQIAILSFEANGEVITRASGNVADRIGRPAESGILVSIHKSGLIAMRLYEGALKIVNWSDSDRLMSFNLRLTEIAITDFGFLDTPGSTPSIAYIYQDLSGRHLKVCRLEVKEKELKLHWEQENIESEASLLIPVPHYGGVIVVGQESISYHKSEGVYTAVAPFLLHMSQICCYALVDKSGERILLGDIHGRLFMLVLFTQTNDKGVVEISDIKVQSLGEISIPECMVYLDNSVIFVGSRLGDSQLVRILPKPTETQPSSYIEVIDSFPNLGPIRDLIVINSDGQDQVVTCSGGFKEGSLRIIRSGIGIDEQATVDLPNIRNLFTLRLDSEFDNYIVASFFEYTHLFKIDGEELEDTTMEGFDLDKPTFYAGTLDDGNVLQVSQARVNLISRKGKLLDSKDTPENTLCSVNPTTGQFVVASGALLSYFKAINNKLEVVSTYTFDQQLACVDISAVDDSGESKLMVAGFWTENSVKLFVIEDDKFVKAQDILESTEFLPRSLLLARMEDVVYVMCGLGDGTLYYFQLDSSGNVSEPRKATLGTQPTKLRQFFARNTVNVFACSDRPAVIYSSNQKLVFSNVNLKMVTQMCPLNSEFYSNSLVLADNERIFIGVIDDIQKLHIRSVPLGESVSRLAYQEETNSIAALTQRMERILPNGNRQVRNSASTLCSNRTIQQPMTGTTSATHPHTEMDTEQLHSICLFDVNTFELLHVIELPSHEYALSIASVKLGPQSNQLYFVVGTAIFNPDDPECKQGRILIYTRENQCLKLVTEKEVSGGVYSIESLDNKLLCAINSAVRLFIFIGDTELRLDCSSFNFITALYLKTKGDLVLVGDIMRSMTLLAYTQMNSQFTEAARDYNTEWLTACEIIDSESMIGAENAYNLFTVQKDVHTESADERIKFKQNGFWYLGENVNVFRRGSLLTSNMEQSSSYKNPILFGSADGALGVIVQLDEKVSKLLLSLQKAIAANINNCTRISYDQYRNFSNDKKQEKHSGFIDGDLIEGINEMSKEKVVQIVNEMNEKHSQNTSVEEILRLVEDMSRLH